MSAIFQQRRLKLQENLEQRRLDIAVAQMGIQFAKSKAERERWMDRLEELGVAPKHARTKNDGHAEDL